MRRKSLSPIRKTVCSLEVVEELPDEISFSDKEIPQNMSFVTVDEDFKNLLRDLSVDADSSEDDDDMVVGVGVDSDADVGLDTDVDADADVDTTDHRSLGESSGSRESPEVSSPGTSTNKSSSREPNTTSSSSSLTLEESTFRRRRQQPAVRPAPGGGRNLRFGLSSRRNSRRGRFSIALSTVGNDGPVNGTNSGTDRNASSYQEEDDKSYGNVLFEICPPAATVLVLLLLSGKTSMEDTNYLNEQYYPYQYHHPHNNPWMIACKLFGSLFFPIVVAARIMRARKKGFKERHVSARTVRMLIVYILAWHMLVEIGFKKHNAGLSSSSSMALSSESTLSTSIPAYPALPSGSCADELGQPEMHDSRLKKLSFMSLGSHVPSSKKSQEPKEEEPQQKKRRKYVQVEEESDSEEVPAATSFSQSMYRLGGFRTSTTDEIVPGPSSAPTANQDEDDGAIAPITYSYDFILVNPDLSWSEKARMILERMNAGFRKSKRWTPKYATGTRGARTNDFVPPQRRVASSSSYSQESISGGNHVAIPFDRPHWHTQIPLISIPV